MAQACQRHDKANRLREELSCMLVGDGAVGKTSMIISYIFNGYNSEYRQTAFDVFTGLVHVNGIPTRIKLIDTAGQEEFGHLRSLCYAHVDVFILCFSVVNPVSFDNITSKWIPQIRAGNTTSPIILVGTQSDLRHNVDILIHLDQRSTKPVPFSGARRLAHRIRAHDYVECSALTQHNLKDVFDCAVFAAIKHKHAATNSKKLSLLKRLKFLCDCGWRKLFRFC
uniref:rho-related GTP-binding protein RhoV-like n=1 Tax=Scatophagus argus TaxID=75038 RepID=UPI001ED7FED9|nr:rho-related GTP-binding protein RhoV-like [Scatophagus argus]